MSEFIGGVIVCGIGLLLLIGAYQAGKESAQKEVRRLCETYQVVDLPYAKATFYCSREPK
jgi:hypothetical protein